MIAEFIVAAVSLAVSLIFFVETFSFPHVNADPGGLALFPRIFSIMTAIPAIILIARFKNQVLAQKHTEQEKTTLVKENILKNKTFVVFLLTVLFPVILFFLGFLPACILFVFLLVKILGGSTKGALFFSIVLSGILFYVFGVLAGLRLPRGVFEAIFNQ